MNSFGLGLVLSFVDKASAGMNTATANFNRLSATADSLTSSVSTSATEMAAVAFSLSAVGDTFVSIGESITGVFTGMTEQVINTGMTMMGFRSQLNALYGDEAEAKIQQIKEYARTSVFEVEGLMSAVTMMKTVGIEAMDEVTTSSGKTTQKLLDYASDLAAMIPNMRNVYGTGVEAAMGAFKEYIAEGNAMSLKRGAGLDITEQLGEDKGKTVAERTQQIADLIDKLNIAGYTKNLENTPTQQLAKLQDTLFNLKADIADSGVFESYSRVLAKLSGWVESLYENTELYNTVVKILGETISTVLSPLEKMLDWVIANSEAIVNWIKENPKLVKNILLVVAAIGAFLIVGGSFLKLLSSIAFAMSGLNVLKSLPMLFGKLVTAILPFIGLAGIAYAVWSSNLGGIQEKVTWLVNNIGDIFTVLSDAWGDFTLSPENFQKAKELGILPFIEGILQLKYYWDFFIEGFKKGFTSFFEGLVKGLGALGIDVEDLGQKFVDFLKKLTQPGAEDEWVKLGETLGGLIAMFATLALAVKVVTPVINFFITLGKIVRVVFGVFKSFWNILKSVWNVLKWVFTIGKSVVSFFKDMGAAISLMKQGFGFWEVMGTWFPKLAGFFTKTGALFAKFGGFFLKIGGLFTKFGGWIVAGAKAIGAAVMSVLTAIAGFLSIPVWAVVAIIAAVVATIALIIIFRDELWNLLVWIWSSIGKLGMWLVNAVADMFSGIWEVVSTWVGNIISNIVQAILSNPIVQSIIGVLTSIYNVIANVVMTIVTYIVGVAKVIWSVIKLIATVIAGVAKVAWAIISGIVKVIWACIKGAVNFIVTVVTGIAKVVAGIAKVIWTVIKGAVNIIWNIIKAAYQFIRMIFYAILAVGKIIITGIVNAFKWFWNLVKPIIQAVGDFFKKIFDWIKNNVVMPVVDWIVFAFTWVKDKVTTILTAIGDFFKTIFDWINNNIITPFREFIGMVFDWISEKVDAVTAWMSEAFDTCASWIKDVFQGVADFFSGVWDSIAKGATKFFNWIADGLDAVVSVLSAIGDFFGSIIGSAGNFFGSIGNKLKGFVGLDTGGYVKTEGLAVLHPNEVVVNDDTTKRLQNFLGTYESASPTALNVPSEKSSSSGNSYVPFTAQSTIQEVPASTSDKAGETHNDYSVTFAAGSVVIQLLNATDAELEKAAEKIMKIIARKQQLRAMAVRK